MELEQGSTQREPAKPVAKPETVVPKRTVFRRTRQVLAWLILIVMTLGFAGVIFTQLPIFRRIIVNQLVSIVEDGTNGTLVIKEIQGNLWNGFVMNDVTLKLKTGTRYDSVDFFHADHILAKYSLIRWLRKSEFGITSMVIQRPTIRLVKFAGDTLWNYNLLTKPVAAHKTPTPFTQIIDVASFRIQDGRLVRRDYNYPPRQTKVIGTMLVQVEEKEIDWSDVQMEGLELDSRFYAHGASAQSAKVHHLRFTEKQSGFFVQHLEFSGYIDSNQARMDKAKITTGHTSIGFSLEVAPPRIFKTGLFTSMEHSSVNLSLKGPTISTYELKQFLPSSLGFLAGSPGIDLDATGEFGHLKIKRLLLDFKNRGDITINGDLTNLHHPDSFRMDLALQARNISNETLNDYVPGLHIPSLSRFGLINISSLTYNGVPLNFHTVFDAKSSGAGNLAADVNLDLRNHHFDYRAGLRTEHLNIAAFGLKSGFETSLNAQAKLAGSGADWKMLTTAIDLKTTAPSIFDKYHILNLDLNGAMKHGAADVGHLDAAMEGGPDVHVRHAMVDLLSPQVPYKFDGTIKNLRLAEVVASAAHNPARIDLDANVAGLAKNFDELSGTARVKLFDLSYQGHPLADVNANLSLAPTVSGENKLTLESEMADISIDHRFRLGDLIHTLPQHIVALVTAIKERDFPQTGATYPAESYCADSVDFDYTVRVKDLRPLAGFVPQTFLLAEGNISGAVSGCRSGAINLTMEGDSLGFILRNREGYDSSFVSLDSFAIADSLSRRMMDSVFAANRTLHVRDTSRAMRDTLRVQQDTSKALALPRFGFGAPRIHITPTTFRLIAHNLSNDPKLVLGSLDASLDFLTDSVIRLGSALLYHPKFGMIYKDQVLNFDLATVYNDVLALRLKGDARFPAGDFDFTLDTLRASYLNRAPGVELTEYRVMNESPTHVRIAQSGLISIDTLNLIHPLLRGRDPLNASVLRMSLGGQLHGDSVSAWARIPSFHLEELPRILPPMKPGSKTMAFANVFQGQVRNVKLDLNGTLERPDIALKLFADTIAYNAADNRIVFDSNAVDLAYRNQALRGALTLHVARVETAPGSQAAIEPDSISALRAVIDSIPMIIAFKHGPTYSSDSAAIAARPLSASINTSHFPIDVATPFIPAFREMHGSGDIHFGVTGTQNNIQYNGSANVHEGEFLLAGTNMGYLFDGSLVFADNLLKLQDIKLRNMPADDPYGEAMVNGIFNFRGFSIASFDLRLHSDRLMVLSNDSRESLKSIYGPVKISTDGQDFHFRNTLEAPWINGTIDILSAKLTLPQSNGGVQMVSSDDIVYRTIPSDSAELARAGALHFRSASAALVYAADAGSVRLTALDDTLFPNRMKNIYLNEDGSIRNADSLQSETATQQTVAGPSFTDKLRMDIRVNTPGDISLVIPFNGVFGILGAQLDAGLKSDGSISIQRDDDLGSAEVDGTIDLTPNSTFRFYQTFAISSGHITFNKDFSNPDIYIVADYIGTHKTQTGADEQAKIELIVSGKKSEPKLDAHIYTNGGTGTYEERPETAPVEDAIYFLASGGYFKSDLDPTGQANILQNVSKNIGTSLLASMLSGYIGSTGSEFAIRSASLNGFTAAYRNVVFRYNLASAMNPGSADYIFDFPLNTLINSQSVRTMMIELQLHPNSQTTNTSGLAQQPLFLTRFIWTPIHF